MAGPFEVGDVVRLKSGGPIMTVTQCAEASMSNTMTVWCTWFDKLNPKSDTFPAAVAKYEPRPTGASGTLRLA